MTLLQLKYAVTVADTGSITAGAEKLYIAQPSLSKALRLLEEELGFSIFVRSRKGICVSEDGAEFISYARRVLEQSDLLEERYGKEQKRRKIISISTQHVHSAQVAFASIISEFGGDEYSFSLHQCSPMEVIQEVESRKSGVGVIAIRKDNRRVMMRILRENELTFTPVYEVPIVAWMATDHPLTQQKTLKIADLPDWPIINYAEEASIHSSVVSEDIDFDLNFRKTIRVGSNSEIPEILKKVPAIFLGGQNCLLREPGIVSKPLDKEEVVTVGMIRYQNTYLSSMESLFIEEMKRAGLNLETTLEAGGSYVRNATMEDLPYLMDIYSHAKKFMEETGNPYQWSDSYPAQDDIIQDILNGESHVIVVDKKIQAVFTLTKEKTIGYDALTEGAWINDEKQYMTIHRLASYGTQRGMAKQCIRWCAERAADLRADTHEQNLIMQHIFLKNGFEYCGKTKIFDGTERLVYQRVQSTESTDPA